MIKTDVLILGGGLAGLSTAHHLNELGTPSSLVIEKRSMPGGTAGSVRQDGFIFDYTGHLLHLHDPYGKKFICGLLRGNLLSHERSSSIYSHGLYTPYPFQANTYGLPEEVVDDCVAGFLETLHNQPTPLGAEPSFQDWCLGTFGKGISRHFMLPYNCKLWRVPLPRLTTEWQGRFVPKPLASEVLRGSLWEQQKAFGYNAVFRYPKRGGIQALADALAARLKPGQLRLAAPLVALDSQARVAVAEGLGEISYRRLVNTLPLPDFLKRSGPWPEAVRRAQAQLRHRTVYCLNLGVARPHVTDKHWIYFPEKNYPFYRVGCYSNFSASNAPSLASSLYIEVSRRPEEKVDLDRLERQIIHGLRSCGILKASDRLIVRQWMPIPCAYVVYDFNRTPAVRTIFSFLRKVGVESIGRYGGWKYSFMEETILDGKRCAERLSRRRVPGLKEKVSGGELRPLK